MEKRGVKGEKGRDGKGQRTWVLCEYDWESRYLKLQYPENET